MQVLSDTIRVTIDSISEIAISAKDIRSRIPTEMTLDQDVVGTYRKVDDAVILAEGLESSPLTETLSDSESSFAHVQLASREPNKSVPTDIAVCRRNNAAESGKLDLTACVYVEEVAFVFTDDCVEAENQLDEYLRLTLSGVGLVLRPIEMRGERLHMQCNDLFLCVHSVQLDNQLFRRFPYEFPTVLASLNLPTSVARMPTPSCMTDAMMVLMKESGAVTIRAKFDKLGSSSSPKEVRIKVSPLAVFVEDKLALKLMDLASSFDAMSSPRKHDEEESFLDGNKDALNTWKRLLPSDVLVASHNLSHHLYLSELLIEPIDVSMSVHASVKMHIGLEQSPLNFSAFHRKDLRTTSFGLGQELARHYISGALFRAGWVMGSLDLIGSPSGFTRAVGSGLHDFVALPYRGILQGPWAFVNGVTSGSTSLVKHVSAGTLTSVTNFASSVSRNLDLLSLDQEHRVRNEVSRRERPKGLGEGLANGLSGVGISLLGAVGGIAHHPIQAVMEGGLSPTGLAAGVARGLVGVVTKPLGGAAELVAQTGQGLLHGTGWTTSPEQKVPPVPEPTCALSCGELKYSWKMLHAGVVGNDTQILYLADAVATSEPSLHLGHGGATEVSLIITPTALVVITVEEDAVEVVHQLLEVDLESCEEDPTKVTLSLSLAGDSVGSRADRLGFRDRVKQFVMETAAGGHCTVSDIETEETGENAADVEEKVPKKAAAVNAQETNAKKIYFFMSPSARNKLQSVADMAKRKIEQKGFAMI